MSPDADAAKAETCFKRALSTAREQQAKSWELRAAMSMARLWRDQSKRLEALDLLASVDGWFTEGVDTLDLKEAKGLARRAGVIRTPIAQPGAKDDMPISIGAIVSNMLALQQRVTGRSDEKSPTAENGGVTRPSGA